MGIRVRRDRLIPITPPAGDSGDQTDATGGKGGDQIDPAEEFNAGLAEWLDTQVGGAPMVPLRARVSMQLYGCRWRMSQ